MRLNSHCSRLSAATDQQQTSSRADSLRQDLGHHWPALATIWQKQPRKARKGPCVGVICHNDHVKGGRGLQVISGVLVEGFGPTLPHPLLFSFYLL